MPAFPNPYGGYSPFQTYYPTMQAAAPQPIQPAPVPQPSSIIWVGGMSEAQMYPVAPNNAVALWDSSAPAIYLKQADASGKPSMKVFDLVERTAAPSQTAEPAQVKTPAFATKKDLEALNEAIEGFRDELDRIRADMFSRRRTPTKKEEDE